jgi:hypothetical protein
VICGNCSKELPDSAKVCGYCGTRLIADNSRSYEAAVSSGDLSSGDPAATGGVAVWADPADEVAPEDARRRCPFCAEWVLEAAILCKHCGSRLDLMEPPRSPISPPISPPAGGTTTQIPAIEQEVAPAMSRSALLMPRTLFGLSIFGFALSVALCVDYMSCGFGAELWGPVTGCHPDPVAFVSWPLLPAVTFAVILWALWPNRVPRYQAALLGALAVLGVGLSTSYLLPYRMLWCSGLLQTIAPAVPREECLVEYGRFIAAWVVAVVYGLILLSLLAHRLRSGSRRKPT